MLSKDAAEVLRFLEGLTPSTLGESYTRTAPVLLSYRSRLWSFLTYMLNSESAKDWAPRVP